jgi:membrane protein
MDLTDSPNPFNPWLFPCIPKRMAGFWALVSEAFNEWMEDKAPRLGAALAYYAAFSIAPLLVLLVATMGFFSKGDRLQQIQNQIASLAGDNAADAIVTIFRGVKSSNGGGAATIVSVITLFIGATGMFGQLQDAMNTIWEVTPKPRRVWVDVLRSRLLSFALVLAIGILLLASLLLSAYLAVASRYFQQMLPMTGRIWPFVDFALSFAITTMLFAAVFKILPDVYIAWRDVWLGAAVTAVLFAIGKIGIGLYLGRSSFTSAYGAAGSFLVMLAWVYYSSQILFFGAEFTQVYTIRQGHNFRPARGARFLSDEMRIHQGIPHTELVEKTFKDENIA